MPMKQKIIRWLWVAALVTIILHTLSGSIVIINALIPNSTCGNFEGFDRHPCSLQEVAYGVMLLPIMIFSFSYGLSFLIPFLIIFLVGLMWSYIKRK